PSDADVTREHVGRAIPCWLSKSPGSVFPPAVSESARHRVDHVSACAVPLHGFSPHLRPDSQSAILLTGPETTASVQSLRCPQAPGAVAGNKTRELRCLHAVACGS